MSLLIDVQPNEYYGPFSYEGTGLKVLLHDQNEGPDIENLGMDVTPGYNTNIRIQRSKVTQMMLGGGGLSPSYPHYGALPYYLNASLRKNSDESREIVI